MRMKGRKILSVHILDEDVETAERLSDALTRKAGVGSVSRHAVLVEAIKRGLAQLDSELAESEVE